MGISVECCVSHGCGDAKAGSGVGRIIKLVVARAGRGEEARDITRYLTNLLIFLGLLGTLYGLSTTVPAVVDTIRALAPKQGESSAEVFSKLMTGLESQLGGMGTAFSSSLLGLAGSLVVGFHVPAPAQGAPALAQGAIPPTAHLDEPAGDCVGVDHVLVGRHDQTLRAALSSSFAFGGSNAVLAFGKVIR